MTRAEMRRRLATMTADQVRLARRMLKEGRDLRDIAAEAGITLKQAHAVAEWEDRYPYLVPTTAKSEAPRSTPLADFDAAIFGPAPPPRSTALDAATVERNLDAIRAEARAVKARLYPSED